jgi:hypothetical protein
MADKLKPGISVRTTFVDGESPKAAKLNSLSSQLQNASQRLESAIGDIHSESYPYSSLSNVHLGLRYGRNKTSSGGLLNAPTRPLDIANLGRIIGPASNLNPHQMESQSITETVPTGVHEFATHFPPEDPTALVFLDTAVFASAQTLVSALDDPGDYYVDSYGKVYSVSETNGGTVTYTYNPRTHEGGNTYQNASFNVIPDINQCENGTGCTVAAIDANGRRPITLPTITHHHYDVNGTTVVLGADDPLYNQQLLLPKILIDNWSVEEEIPGGYLYLKNYTKNKVYKNATYYYNSSSSILMGGEDITDDVNDGDTFCIITVGTDITTSIDDLRKKLHHSHNRSFGEPLIPIDAIVGAVAIEGNSGVFSPSQIPGNYFPQYMHRDGFSNTFDANMNDYNIMRGDLGIGVSGAGAGNYRTAVGESYKLRFFGLGTSSTLDSTIYKDADGDLEIEAGSLREIQTKSTLAIHSGIQGGNDALSHAFAPKIHTAVYANLSVEGGGHLYIDLDTDYGYDTTIVPVGVQVMVSDDNETNKIWSTGATNSGYEISWILYGPTSSIDPWFIDIGLDGASWDLGSNEYAVRIIVWYLDT